MPPLGHSTQLRVFIDPNLLQLPEVWAAAGTWHLARRLRYRASPVGGGKRAADQQGVTHVGVVLRNNKAFEDLVARVDAAGVAWIPPPEVHSDPGLSGKMGGKLADPSSNVIEVTCYADVAVLLA